MTARTRKPTAAKAGGACVVPDCVPDPHGAVVDGLCPVHRQTHPGLARRDQPEQPDPAVVAAEREAADRKQREDQAAAEQRGADEEKEATGD